MRIGVNCVQFCGCGRGYSAQRGRVGESSRCNATIFEAANRYVYNRNQCTAQVPVPHTVVQRTNMCSRKRMGYAPIRCAANGCFSSWQPALPPFMLTVHSYKLWCWRDVEPNHILSYISNVQMDKGHSHDDMSPSSVNCILQWLLMLMHCAGSTRTRAVELLRECLCKVPLECCQPTSLFSLARDLAIFIRTLSSIQYPRDNCILKTLELTAVRLAMHGYTGKLKVFHPKHLAGFVSEFARLKAVRQRVGGSAELTFSLDFCVATADGLLQLTTPPTNIRKVLA